MPLKGWAHQQSAVRRRHARPTGKTVIQGKLDAHLIVIIDASFQNLQYVAFRKLTYSLQIE